MREYCAIRSQPDFSPRWLLTIWCGTCTLVRCSACKRESPPLACGRNGFASHGLRAGSSWFRCCALRPDNENYPPLAAGGQVGSGNFLFPQVGRPVAVLTQGREQSSRTLVRLCGCWWERLAFPAQRSQGTGISGPKAAVMGGLLTTRATRVCTHTHVGASGCPMLV